ncbi:hypothetical protein NLI96_g5999 [Meripilus lineatus]|uniref:Srp40 C-terminal domain-containing protein n=1 Tax=Meripilus lineatus TaxID=2056292 RepID=A0AAD5V3R5_9APHY|nr:hypothetical protein NLI96_g5999 [Physisporinus lineatus]
MSDSDKITPVVVSVKPTRKPVRSIPQLSDYSSDMTTPSDTDESSSDDSWPSSSDVVRVTKRRRTDQAGSGVATAAKKGDSNVKVSPSNGSAVIVGGKGPTNGSATNGSGSGLSSTLPSGTATPTGTGLNGKANGKGAKPPRKANTPFQRVKAENVTFLDERLKDNSFESRGAKFGDYGERASKDLIVTRGAGFRKEKNKKKRGSYRGGDISMESHAIKFTD